MDNDWVDDLRRDKEAAVEPSKVTQELRRAESVYSLERRAPKNPRENIARQRARRIWGRSGVWRASRIEDRDVVLEEICERRAGTEMKHRDRDHWSGSGGNENLLVAL